MGRTLKIVIDGDVSVDYKFKINGKELPILKNSVEKIDEYIKNNEIWLGK
jgi:hypothetical protein